jgi:hypothetical protein
VGGQQESARSGLRADRRRCRARHGLAGDLGDRRLAELESRSQVRLAQRCAGRGDHVPVEIRTRNDHLGSPAGRPAACTGLDRQDTRHHATHVYRLEARDGGTTVHSAESWEGLAARLLRRSMQRQLANRTDHAVGGVGRAADEDDHGLTRTGLADGGGHCDQLIGDDALAPLEPPGCPLARSCPAAWAGPPFPSRRQAVGPGRRPLRWHRASTARSWVTSARSCWG